MTDLQKEQVMKFRVQGLGYGAIAEKMSLSKDTVKSHCRRHRIRSDAEIKAAAAVMAVKRNHCRNCGAEILQMPGTKEKRFCSDKCRNGWWNSHLDQVNRKAYYRIVCAGCGKTFEVYGAAKRKYCCHECYIADRFGTAVSE